MTTKLKKDFRIRGKNIIHAVTRKKVGEIKPGGTCVGPHPWYNDTEVICSSPEELRAAQRDLAQTECC